ncbi:MAG: putative baseplate assembly protein [Sneathiella sp.]
MIYHCCDARRRELVIDHLTFNGIDFLEVLDTEAPAGTPVQRTLLLRFLKTAPALTVDNFELTGGERISGIQIDWVTPADNPDLSLIDPIEVGLPGYLMALHEPDRVLALRTTSNGDFSTYTLRLVAAPGSLAPPTDIDRLLSHIDFSFKVECPSDFDCAPFQDCPEEASPLPALSYLAKDFQSFRRLMLQRMSQIMPDWRERNTADIGITLVESLAYTGDRLSYAQDAVATEAYLATARRRSSVRRHARLVDYHMHDGANARAWIHVNVSQNGRLIRPGLERFLTRLNGLPPGIAVGAEQSALDRGPEVFEPLHEQPLLIAHNQMNFYDWGDAECCLPKGANRATLRDDLPGEPIALQVGDVLIFEERLGPNTGLTADADLNQRCAVRLCAVETGLIDALTTIPIVEIRWAEEDALPFPICLSSRADEIVGGGLIENVSHALGNIVLCDHGLSLPPENLGSVLHPHLHLVSEPSGGTCKKPALELIPPRFHPKLEEGPVTQAAPYDPNAVSAFASTEIGLSSRSSSASLTGTNPVGDKNWNSRRDLLQSISSDTHFVLEIERDQSSFIRFGDNSNGLRPASGTSFTADYRIGNGTTGNIGADAIHHLVTNQGSIEGVRNPMPASGGINPESMEEVRRSAPYAYRRQERAVTAEDYADIARRHPDVQRAAATFRWNGHGHTVFISVDRFGGRSVTPEFETALRHFINKFRMAGYDLEINEPIFVPMELDLFVCASPDHVRGQVRQEIIARLNTTGRTGRGKGFFHPDNFTFGDPLYLSAIYAAAMEIEGVTSVTATRFRRRGRPDPVPLLDGVIRMDRLEILQLENNPNFPERGAFNIDMGGGK